MKYPVVINPGGQPQKIRIKDALGYFPSSREFGLERACLALEKKRANRLSNEPKKKARKGKR